MEKQETKSCKHFLRLIRRSNERGATAWILCRNCRKTWFLGQAEDVAAMVQGESS